MSLQKSFAVLLLMSCPVVAQHLRVVSLNASNAGSATAAPRPGMELILSAIGNTVSSDPLIEGNSGIVRAIDILCLQEARGSQTTAVAYAALLNQIYQTDRYAAGVMDGASTGSGTQVVVYNTLTVELLAESSIGTVSITGAPRQPLRHHFRPRGYIGAAGDLFIYNVHFKAGNTSSDRSRRLMEASDIRVDADALGSSRNVIYLGDLNVYTSNEPAYQKLQEHGPAAAFDPISSPGSWSNSAAFKAIHTQSPWDATLSSITGFNGSPGGMDDRFDQQLVSAEILTGGSGLEYVVNSYHAFGNDGSHTMDMPITTGSGASQDVLLAMSGILDHLPVVADYALRPRLGLAHPGDANLDTRADISDFAIVAGNFNRPGDWFTGDFTADGMTGIADFSLLAANFNTSAARAVVPEPGGMMLLVGAMVLFRRRRG